MTTIETDGGIGNQLFQLAVGLLIAKTWGVKIYFDRTNYKSGAIHEGFLLDRFVLRAETMGLSCETVEYKTKFNKWLDYGIARLKDELCLESKPYQHKSELLERKWRYISGSWQSYKYLQNNPCIAIVRKELDLMFRKQRYVDKMIRYSDCVVAIHVRRGDYLLSKNKGYGALPMTYYLEAMSRAKDTIKGCKFIVFSDDAEYVSNMFTFEDCITVNQILGVGSSLRDLYLMSKCNAMITANSSLSWWGATLQENDQIITPAKWFNDKSETDMVDFIPHAWTRIEI